MILYLLWLMRKTWNNTIWLLFKKKKTRSNNIKINQEKNLYSFFEIYIISFQKLSIQKPPIFRTFRILQETIPNLLPAFINQTTSDPKHRPTSPIKFHSNGIHTPPRLFPSASDTNRPADDDQRVEKIRGAAAEREKPWVENWPTHWSSARNWKKRMKKKKKGEKKERRGEERQR